MLALGHPKALKVVIVISLCGAVAVATVLLGLVRPALALVAAFAILRVGLIMLRSLARPASPPLEPGLLRQVRIHYRCSICGAEVKMTTAPDDDPEPPRHCQDEMALVVPID